MLNVPKSCLTGHQQPVCNEEGDVVGLLDITKVFHESLEKLERAYGSSQKLYSALEGVQSEWGPNNSGGFGGAHGLMSYVEALREKMSFPDLGSILDARTRAVTVSVKTSVREAAKLMRDNRTTAVCVVEDGGKLAGIFTSKDVVLRVIAAGLEARTCSVVRVMTPHPDTGLPTLSIQQALRKMNGEQHGSQCNMASLLSSTSFTDGRFLNLPVLEEDGTLVGCVDVLKLTYATLEQVCLRVLYRLHPGLTTRQVSSIGAEAGGDAAGGPLWSRFFSSFAGAAADGDTESVVSDTNAPSSINNGTPSAVPRHMQRGDSQYTNGSTSPSEIHPNDSASVNNDEDEVSEIGRRANGSKPGTSAVASGVGKATVPEHDDGTYLFKFISPSGTTHRFVARHDNFSTVRDIIGGKLSSDPFFVQYNSTRGAETGVIADPSEFMISYTDDDGDVVLMSADGDLEDSVKTARKQGKDRVLLTIKGGKDWDAAITNAAEQQALQQEAALKRQPLVPPTVQVHDHDATSTDDDDEKTKVNRSLGEKPRGKSAPRKSWVQGGDDLVLGFLSKEMVLPAAVVFTGFAVIAVFLLNRPTQK